MFSFGMTASLSRLENVLHQLTQSITDNYACFIYLGYQILVNVGKQLWAIIWPWHNFPLCRRIPNAKTNVLRQICAILGIEPSSYLILF